MSRLSPLQKRLLSALPSTWCGHRHSLKRRIYGLPPELESHSKLEHDIELSIQRCLSRQQSVPSVTFPEQLPITGALDEIAKLLKEHQIIVVAGETGSGKTTQLPKLCLSLGYGVHGFIGHTQPRRLAARQVAGRVAEELGCALGHQVGYQVRFHDRTQESTLIKLMTDGIILNECQHDRFLSNYEVLIIDEAHERSLNIDFLLGFLKQLCEKRRDLKVIITSATINLEAFSSFFKAPVVQIEGRTYPVEVFYRPIEETDDEDLIEHGLIRCVEEALQRGPGDLLAFMSGEAQIRSVADSLKRHFNNALEVMPLYARLPLAEQQRVFKTSQQRRIILATNVAETSLTVPNIVTVIDTGFAKISRYSVRSKIQRLPIEAISKASCDQRKGRAGRVRPGVCYRLYSEMDYQTRNPFTQPEIQRTNLAQVILQMKALRLGDIEAFPFIEPPEDKAVRDGVLLLQQLGALDAEESLTPIGAMMARLPLDCRLARIIIEAHSKRCLKEICIIVAGLSVVDPREWPSDKRQAAQEMHSLTADAGSDFISLLRLWEDLEVTLWKETAKARQRLAYKRFLSLSRCMEWRDVYQQLLDLVEEMDLKLNTEEASVAAIHQAILTGLIPNVACKTEEGDFLAPRQLHVNLFHQSMVKKKAVKWIMAYEWLETQRVYALTVGAIEPEWIEEAAKPLLKYHYSDPHWEKKSGQVVAIEKVSLYGLPVIANRRVSFGRVDLKVAREIFIREALIPGELDPMPKVIAHNLSIIHQLQNEEDRARRQVQLLDEEKIFDFYDKKLPEDMSQLSSLQAWLKIKGESVLKMTQSMIESEGVDRAVLDLYPTTLVVKGITLSLDYQFNPGKGCDGVTVRIPLEFRSRFKNEDFSWMVPGLLNEQIVALIKSLPKVKRRSLIPVSHFSKAFIERAKVGEGDILVSLSQVFSHMTGVEFSPRDFDLSQIPAHLKMSYAFISPEGQVMDSLTTLEDLKPLDVPVLVSSAKEASKTWSFGALESFKVVTHHQQKVPVYLGLTPTPQGAVVQEFDREEVARNAHRAGVLSLIYHGIEKERKQFLAQIKGDKFLALQFKSFGTWDTLLDDFTYAVIMHSGLDPLPRASEEFDALVKKHKSNFVKGALSYWPLVRQVIQELSLVEKQIQQLKPPLADNHSIRLHYRSLSREHFLKETLLVWLSRYPIYLAALRERIVKFHQDPLKDKQLHAEVAGLVQAYERFCNQYPGFVDEQVREFGWLLEEFRISLFAQKYGTIQTVSRKRLSSMWAELLKKHGF